MMTTRKSLLAMLPMGEGWESFHTLYFPYLQRVARIAGVPRGECADAAQSVIGQVFQKISQYSAERGRFRSWLRAIVRNYAVDWFRQRRQLQQTNASLSHLAISLDELERQHRLELLRKGLKTIQAESSALAWACFERQILNRTSAKQVAADLGITVNAVYLNSSRTLSRVRQWCLNHGEDFSC